MCSDLGEGSRCCAAYSIVGAIFTLWVGVMLTTQPFFVGGIEDVDNAQKSAYGAFFMFLFTFVVSAIGMWYDSTFGKTASSSDDDGIDADYQLAGAAVPNYGTSA